MHFDQLMYLVDISKTNSINTTAKRMFSSQQAVSESIKRLENEINCTILNRSKTGVDFTEDGKYVLAYAIQMLSQYNALLQHFQQKEHPQQLQGKLSISIAPLANSMLLSELLLKMRNYFPNVFLYTQEHTMEVILKLLVDSKIDFGLLGFYGEHPEKFEYIKNASAVPLHLQALYHDELVCVMSKNNPISVQEVISFEQFHTLKHTVYGYSSNTIPEGNGIYVSNNTEVHQKFMKEEGTVCLMPYQAFQQLYPKKDFVHLSVVDAKPVTTYLICRDTDDLYHNGLYQTFIHTTLSLVHHS